MLMSHYDKPIYDKQNEWFVLLPLVKNLRFFIQRQMWEIKEAIEIVFFGQSMDFYEFLKCVAKLAQHNL